MSAITAAGLTGAQKCAILVLLLEEAQAAELLRIYVQQGEVASAAVTPTPGT